MLGFSETAARDPLFYRLHTHYEDLAQQFRDTRLSSYSSRDFILSAGVSVVSVRTVIEKEDVDTEEDITNLLITHEEVATITHHTKTQIKYKRINHVPFKYLVILANPRGEARKVIVRIWLNYGSQYIALDRFVHSLSGQDTETIVRRSSESAATMKDKISTIKRFIEDIVNKNTTRTWCGFPHNLLIPRSTNFRHGGRLFKLFVFVNDVDQDVSEGTDGIEHM